MQHPCIEYANEQMHDAANNNPEALTTSENTGLSVEYIIQVTAGDYSFDLIYLLSPYPDREGGDAQIFSRGASVIDERYEQESSNDGLNKVTDRASEVFKKILAGEVGLEVKRGLLGTHLSLVEHLSDRGGNIIKLSPR